MVEKLTSGFDLAIGTGLSMETLFKPVLPVYDESREIPKGVDLKTYDSIWINISTLLRNLFSSIDENTFNSLKRSDASSLLLSEMNTISSLFSTNTNNQVKVNFYICDYSSLDSLIPYGFKVKPVNLRIARTPKAVNLLAKMNQAIEGVLKLTDEVHKFKSSFRGGFLSRSLIFTHYPYDLTNYNKFKELVLLESNTGKIKYLKDWWSKYYQVPGEDMSMLPFNRKLLIIFGDKNMFSPAPLTVRKAVMEVAKKKKWHPLTREDAVIFDINANIKDSLIVDFIQKI